RRGINSRCYVAPITKTPESCGSQSNTITPCPESWAWTRYEPCMATIVELDTGQVLGIVDGRDHKGVGD
ncbi:hypothetical protein, partial [Pseudarthrobacter sp. MDT3-1]